MSKKNYEKEEIRGTIKEIMKVRGLRSISVSNYDKWKGNNDTNKWLHSIKINLEDGYLHMYDYNPKTPQAGTMYEKPTLEMYEDAYKKVKSILKDESNIPSKIKRNILVKMCR